MEKAFKVTKNSKYYKDFTKYMELVESQRKFVKGFFETNNIKAKNYYIGGNGFFNVPFENESNINLYIIPTENDNENYGKQLTKPDDRGLCRFKKTSKIRKLFARGCVENKIVINIADIDLRDYFSMDWQGYSQTRIPCEEGYLLKVKSNGLKDGDIPQGFEEIKLSEFHLALEEYEENRKGIE